MLDVVLVLSVLVVVIGGLLALIRTLIRPTPEMMELPPELAAVAQAGDDAAPDGEADDSLVAIARYHFPEQANLLRGRLMADGIFAFVSNAHSTQALGFHRLAHGGVRVHVPASRVAEARAIMQAMDAGEFAIDDDDAENDDGGRPSA